MKDEQLLQIYEEAIDAIILEVGAYHLFRHRNKPMEKLIRIHEIIKKLRDQESADEHGLTEEDKAQLTTSAEFMGMIKEDKV